MALVIQLHASRTYDQCSLESCGTYGSVAVVGNQPTEAERSDKKGYNPWLHLKVFPVGLGAWPTLPDLEH